MTAPTEQGKSKDIDDPFLLLFKQIEENKDPKYLLLVEAARKRRITERELIDRLNFYFANARQNVQPGAIPNTEIKATASSATDALDAALQAYVNSKVDSSMKSFSDEILEKLSGIEALLKKEEQPKQGCPAAGCPYVAPFVQPNPQPSTGSAPINPINPFMYGFKEAIKDVFAEINKQQEEKDKALMDALQGLKQDKEQGKEDLKLMAGFVEKLNGVYEARLKVEESKSEVLKSQIKLTNAELDKFKAEFGLYKAEEEKAKEEQKADYEADKKAAIDLQKKIYDTYQKARDEKIDGITAQLAEVKKTFEAKEAEYKAREEQYKAKEAEYQAKLEKQARDAAEDKNRSLEEQQKTFTKALEEILKAQSEDNQKALEKITNTYEARIKTDKEASDKALNEQKSGYEEALKDNRAFIKDISDKLLAQQKEHEVKINDYEAKVKDYETRLTSAQNLAEEISQKLDAERDIAANWKKVHDQLLEQLNKPKDPVKTIDSVVKDTKELDADDTLPDGAAPDPAKGAGYYLKKAQSHRTAKRFNKALAYAEKAYDFDHDNARVNAELGFLYLTAKEYVKSAERSTKAYAAELAVAAAEKEKKAQENKKAKLRKRVWSKITGWFKSEEAPLINQISGHNLAMAYQCLKNEEEAKKYKPARKDHKDIAFYQLAA